MAFLHVAVPDPRGAGDLPGPLLTRAVMVTDLVWRRCVDTLIKMLVALPEPPAAVRRSS